DKGKGKLIDDKGKLVDDKGKLVDDKGKGNEAERDHLKVHKNDCMIQNRLGKLEIDLARAIKANQVNDHDDDLDTLDLENIIKRSFKRILVGC
ncbi:hypothetical protein Tco_0361600, partial [Tanacetum coccineum]